MATSSGAVGGEAGAAAGTATVPLPATDLGRGVRAAFTGRHGGTSPAPWDGFNLGLGVGDDPDRVRTHRAALSRVFGAPIAFATQVHGTAVAIVADPPGSGEPCVEVGEADAMVTDRPDVALAVLVADCVPVLLADPVARVVGCAHAGRQGFVAGVVPSTLDTMAALGARPADVRAVVGPCVCGACYEVPTTMRDDVVARHPAAESTTSWGTPALDLASGVEAQLRGAGVTVRRVDVCTATDERFYSHRRATRLGHTTGRFAGVIRLLPGG